MELLDVLGVETVALGLNLVSADQVLGRISELAASSKALSGIPVDRILAALKSRETLGSTALGGGVAIPHCRLEGAEGFVVGILTTRREVRFDSPDGREVQIFAFVIGPRQDPSTHLELLSHLSRFFRKPGNRRALQNAESPQDAIDIVRDFSGSSVAVLPDIGTNLRMIHVFARSRDAFNDVMDVLATQEQHSAMIVDAERSESYLASIPAFAGFMEARGDDRFGKVVVTVVHERVANQLLRRLEFSCGNAHAGSLLVTVTEIQHAMGTISSPES
ncbi:MAG: PTS sugar transporter subunit IIA [Candidatus Fermentibacteraceae bacterium]